MGVNDCQCLAAKLVEIVMGDRSRGFISVGHVAKSALERLVAIMGEEPSRVLSPDGSVTYLVLDATKDGVRVYAQAYEHDGAEVTAKVREMCAGAL